VKVKVKSETAGGNKSKGRFQDEAIKNTGCPFDQENPGRSAHPQNGIDLWHRQIESPLTA
jgi:hypothetical protein